jgi:hypothetical protein
VTNFRKHVWTIRLAALQPVQGATINEATVLPELANGVAAGIREQVGEIRSRDSTADRNYKCGYLLVSTFVSGTSQMRLEDAGELLDRGAGGDSSP